MYECFMKEIIHESFYDYCEKIYKNICYNNNNCHDNPDILKNDLYDFIENEIEKMSTYNINNILLSYGFDKAFKYYIDNNYTSYTPYTTIPLSDIKNIDSITKKLVYNLIVSAFEIK